MIENNIEELLHIYDQPIYIDAVHEEGVMDAKEGAKTPILILSSPDQINQHTELLLEKMMGACKFQKEDYRLVPASQQSLLQRINVYQPDTVLLFGLSLESETFSSIKEKNKPFRFGGKKFLLCDQLSNIADSPSLKSDLWTNGLKVLFNIN